MADYVPLTDADFNVWQFNLIEILSLNATAMGVPADVITSLKASQARWTDAYDKTSNKHKTALPPM